eukprot:scaffold53740_cov17-Tisochrysis_lutea.AAC.1
MAAFVPCPVTFEMVNGWPGIEGRVGYFLLGCFSAPQSHAFREQDLVTQSCCFVLRLIPRKVVWTVRVCARARAFQLKCCSLEQQRSSQLAFFAQGLYMPRTAMGCGKEGLEACAKGYGKLYAAMGGGKEGLEACVAIEALCEVGLHPFECTCIKADLGAMRYFQSVCEKH